MASDGFKTREEYLLRYEDQTLRALESHSNAFGAALVAAYLLFPAGILLKEADVHARYSLPLMLALYAYLTYLMHVLASLVKDLLDGTREKLEARRPAPGDRSSLKLVHAFSSRIKLASPLGPLQWISLRLAETIARRKNFRAFWASVIAGMLTLGVLLAFLLLPLAGLLLEQKLHWLVPVVLVPARQAIRLCLCFPSPLIQTIRNDTKAYGRFSIERRLKQLVAWLDTQLNGEETGQDAIRKQESGGTTQ